jgi:hypothetical protein
MFSITLVSIGGKKFVLVIIEFLLAITSILGNIFVFISGIIRIINIVDIFLSFDN